MEKYVFMRNIKGVFGTLSKIYDWIFCETTEQNPQSAPSYKRVAKALNICYSG